MSMKVTIRPGGSALCPMCREALSREAKKCPHCHSDLTENAEWKATQANPGGCASLIVIATCVTFTGIKFLA